VSLAKGDVVAGRYEVVRLLGEGGMGAVYEATQKGLARSVALKVILPAKAKAERSRRRFLREARVAASVRHPGVVEIHDFGEHEETLFLAMEMLQGGTLRKIVDEDLPPLPLERVVALGRAIADVLVAAGHAGLVHRDLKPENVVLDRTPDGRERVVVVDFGLAFLEEGDEQTGRLTREGAITGTPDYMSPEQARGAEVGPATDVYSLGCMLYEMLAGECPFSGDTAIVLSRHLFVPPKALRERVPDRGIPGVLGDLVMQMLAKDPADRPDARRVRDVLDGLDPSRPLRMSARADDAPRIGRAARMISMSKSDTSPPPPAEAERLRIGWVGLVDEELATALAVNGIDAVEVEEDALPSGLEVLFVAGASVDRVEELAASRLVIADAKPGDVARLQALIEAGAADVVMRPCSTEALARKVHRAWRRARRGGKA